MANLEQLEAELESARDAMHADRTEETVAAYQAASDALATERTARRLEREGREAAELGEGDAVATPETVAGGTGVNEGA